MEIWKATFNIQHSTFNNLALTTFNKYGQIHPEAPDVANMESKVWRRPTLGSVEKKGMKPKEPKTFGKNTKAVTNRV
ncbi:unnamed protein product [Dovyalis caffra]|uniref:Uncharacterized protein n=1 Tax=Dovyalis caffra TaxID=77055 RepID=A0AAV1RHB9_9ROSI|nr:unnamed protein product [Dovyalis caffra]